MTIDLERVKQLTYRKVEASKRKAPGKRILLAVAFAAAGSVLLLGAGKAFDWRVMVDGKMQQGNYGDVIAVTSGFASMSPEAPDASVPQAVVTHYPDREPDKVAQPGELSLFVCQSDDKTSSTGDFGVCGEETRDLQAARRLAAQAQAKIHWPAALTDDYELLEQDTSFYTVKEQLDSATLLYESFGEWKQQQLFALPPGYDTYVDSMFLRLTAPTGDEFTFSAHLARTDAQVYGGGANAVIERLALAGFDSVTFVSDENWRQLYAWRKIPAVKTVDVLRFGAQSRPKDSLFQWPLDDKVYQWQQYTFASDTLSKEELFALLQSIDLQA